MIYYTDAFTMIGVSTTTATSVSISWTLADDVTVTGYSLSYSNTDTSCFSDSDTVSGIAGSTTQHTLRNLQEFTEYTITVTAMLSGGGTGQVSGTVTTLPAG